MAHIKSRKHAVARAFPPLGTAAAATLFALASPAGAQTAPAGTTQQLKEVRVEGSAPVADYKTDTSANPKYTAPLVDTPQTITVIKDQIIREQGATNLTEALRNAAGVSTFYLGENGNTTTGDAVYMRGFDSSNSIFVDGIRDLGAVSRDTFNIDSVEVVKGPAGSDAGRTAPTGYINLITKKPDMQDSFLGSIGLGTSDYKRGTIDWNKSLTGDNGVGGAFRLNAVMQDAGVDGRDFVKNKRWGVAPSLAWGLNSPTRVYLDYVHVDQDNVPDGGVPTIGLPGYSTPDPKRQFLNFAQPVDSNNFYGTSSDFQNVTSDMFTARIEHDITPDMTVRNTTRWGKTKNDYMLTAFMWTPANWQTPNPAQPATWTMARSNPTNINQENTILVNQTNLTAKFQTGSIAHSVSTGLELAREQQDSVGYFGQNATANGQPLNNGAWPAANLYNPNPYVAGYNRIRNGADSSGQTDTVGVYAFDTLKFNPQWELSGGIRYDHYKTTYDSASRTTTAPVGTLVQNPSLDTSGDLFTGKLGLVYKPTENSSIYAGYGTSAQPPGGANFQLAAGGTGNNANRTDFDPQEASNMELGTKWDVIDKRLSLTAAIFRTEVKNEVVQDPLSLQYYQTGKKRVDGIELGATGLITSQWGVSAGYTTMDTSIVSGPSVLADGSDALAYTPKNAFTSWTTYAFPFGLTIGGGARYTGMLHRGTDGAVGTPKFVDSYWVFDAMASYRVSKNVDLQFNVYNLFDKDYVAAINKSGYRYTPGIPRSARITANFTF